MKARIHALAGVSSFVLIASFWTSTLLAELFLGEQAVAGVKVAVVYALLALVPCIAATGATGFALARRGSDPLLLAKKRRMPFIAMNGLLVLLPAAFYLSAKAQAGEFDRGFYAVQAVELLAGAVNLLLMGLNIGAGRRLHGRREARSNGAQRANRAATLFENKLKGRD